MEQQKQWNGYIGLDYILCNWHSARKMTSTSLSSPVLHYLILFGLLLIGLAFAQGVGVTALIAKIVGQAF